MNQNSKKDAAHDAEIPAIVTSSTESTVGSTETTPRGYVSFSPTNDSKDCINFFTPQNKPIEISYELLGLTPTKMLPICDVLTQMEDDGAWEITTTKKCLTYRLIVFLYGKGYYRTLSSDERINRIKQCIKPVGNRARLSAICCSHESHQVLAHACGFKTYFFMASTARMFFEQPNARGGFPVDAYYRVQNSSNCYIVAVCMYLTIKLQRDHPEQNQLPIDVGYIGRNYVVDTREGLEGRVIHDRGENAMTLCQKIIGKDNCWEKVNCDIGAYMKEQAYRDRQRRTLDDILDGNNTGLVTGFCVCNNFRGQGKEIEENGYWKFDGNSVDCKGEFVTMAADDKATAESERLRTMWDEQLQQAKDAKKSNNRKMNEVIDDVSPRTDDAKDSSETNSTEPESDSEGKHAMVMLGFVTEEIDGKKKRFYMLWNWWASMPLVLVSFEYLVACRCLIWFFPVKLDANITKTVKQSKALAGECCFPDHAENTRFDEY